MKHFLQRLILLIPLLAVFLLTNWFVDPAHLRTPDAYERRIAAMLAQGKAVTNVVNDDPSAILEYHILAQTSAPDVLLLGTSKSKGVDSDFFPGQTFFNAALSGSGLDDQLVLYNLFESRGFAPDEVIFEINPWLLTPGRTSQVPRFAARGAELQSSLLRGDPLDRPMGSEADRPASLVRMITPDYFQSSLLNGISALVNGGADVREYHEGDTPSGLTYFPDGSTLVTPQMIAALGSEIPEAYALKYGWDPPGGIPKQPDPYQRRVFETFVKYLLDSGVKVTFYLPPYHPTSYEQMMASPNRFVERLQKYFIEFAQKNGITVIGSFNPADLGITNADFYDPTHITPEAVLRIFEGSR